MEEVSEGGLQGREEVAEPVVWRGLEEPEDVEEEDEVQPGIRDEEIAR